MNHAISAAHAQPEGGLRFEVHRSALAEAGADAALGAAWVLLWLVFLLALAPPAAAQGAWAQPDPGPSARGVAQLEAAGAG
ncbi:MAG: hypothetical protein NDI82_09480 [Anaeromyxobacteraceae bacterium]|nr:hypothetical protein [Anaeromyxobacteraceae bacterium]